MSEREPDKGNLINFIAATVETMRDRMATKDDLIKMATKDDLAKMATSSDLSRLEARIDVGFAAVRGDIEQIHLRLDSIERALKARLDHIEAEVSRLRSVVYLLVKDRPDMLRLLGHTPEAGDASPL